MSNEKIDILNRDSFVDNVFNVIEKLSENQASRTFAINGEWGSGKSFVLDMLEEKLKIQQSEKFESSKYAVFHYNCWKYDYYDEPLFAIVSSMYHWANLNGNELSSKVKESLESIFVIVGCFANSAVKAVTNVDLNECLDETKKRITKIKNKDKFADKLYTAQDSIDYTRNMLSEIAKEQTIVIVVDELDRCLPEYAIMVLERLHHLFDDIKNLIVILAVDKRHLNNTISQIFGFNKGNNATNTNDIDSYLAKFIDFEIPLDKGIINENYKTKFEEYLSRFDFNDDSINKDEFVSNLFRPLDARSREKIIEKALLIHDLTFDEPVESVYMYVELLWLIIKKECKNNEVYIDRSLYIPSVIAENYGDFANYYEKNIKVHIESERNFATQKNIVYSNNVYSQLFYLLSNNYNWKYHERIGFSGNNKNAWSEQTKRLNQFADLMEIIK